MFAACAVDSKYLFSTTFVENVREKWVIYASMQCPPSAKLVKISVFNGIRCECALKMDHLWQCALRTGKNTVKISVFNGIRCKYALELGHLCQCALRNGKNTVKISVFIGIRWKCALNLVIYANAHCTLHLEINIYPGN